MENVNALINLINIEIYYYSLCKAKELLISLMGRSRVGLRSDSSKFGKFNVYSPNRYQYDRGYEGCKKHVEGIYT